MLAVFAQQQDTIPISSSNEHIHTMKVRDFATLPESDFVEPTQDSIPEDESCSGLAGIQICAINFFQVHSTSIPTSVFVIAFVDNPILTDQNPTFDRDNPYIFPDVLPSTEPPSAELPPRCSILTINIHLTSVFLINSNILIPLTF